MVLLYKNEKLKKKNYTNSNSKCCNPITCQLLPDATCGDGECCDEECNFKPRGTLCRDKRDHECDLPETCSGNSPYVSDFVI